ncbi:MAG: transglutaminase domain-containing protein [Fuerstiella sp.]
MTEIHSRRLPGTRRRKPKTQNPAAKTQSAEVQTETDAINHPQATGWRMHAICIVTTLIAASIFTLTEHDDHRHTFWCAFEMIVQTLLVIVGTVFFRTRLRLLHDNSVVQPIMVMVVTLTLLCEPFQRIFLGQGHPFEVLVMHSQSNLMLALAVCGFRLTFQRLAMLIAVFLTIFSCTISSSTGLMPLTILFAIGCLAWLVATWWETVDRRLASTERSGSPKFWLALAAGIPLLLLLTTATMGANTVTTALKGFMPSSGGTGEFDPFSRGGINDGDALVAGNENIKSFAPLEDAPFLESEKPSLYDMFNDMFDEPPKKVKNQQRAIALPPELLKHIHQKMAEAKQAGREFSVLRSNATANKKRIHDLDTHAMFYIAGRTPARFRMEVYEHFDGITWFPLDGQAAPELSFAHIRKIDDRPWLSIPLSGRGFEIYSGSTTHSVKVANLDGNVIPSPPNIVGVNIDFVDREDMYHVSSTKLVSLQRKSVPEMTPMHVTSEYVDRAQLGKDGPSCFMNRANDITNQLPGHPSTERIRKLAQQWTAGIDHGWQQVEAIESQLRNHYVVDRKTRPADDCPSPVEDFLFRSRRGPEYLFASSAACLLRSLGYSTRLVSGFYADPDNYDQHKQHTAVMAKNAHFWCEVLVGLDTWITIEPSPGYELASPPLSAFGRLLQMIRQLYTSAVSNTLSLVGVMLLIVLVVAFRRSIYERILTWQWRVLNHDKRELPAVSLHKLIDYRLKLAGHPRPSGTTLQRWSRQTEWTGVQDALQKLAIASTVARFAPPTEHSQTNRQSQTQMQHLQVLEQQLSVKNMTSSIKAVSTQSTFATT